jgi:hypothetical protein
MTALPDEEADYQQQLLGLDPKRVLWDIYDELSGTRTGFLGILPIPLPIIVLPTDRYPLILLSQALCNVGITNFVK